MSRQRPQTEPNAKSTSFNHKKSLGQNFLTSPIVPGWMCEAASITTGDTVLEIGPGTGALTQVLLERGAQVVALEADERALATLQEKFTTPIKTGQLTLYHHDARTLNPATLGLTAGEFKVVANIPYYLTGLLLRHCLQTTTQPKVLVFLLQKEVVSRIARDTKESILSISIKAFGTPRYVKTISRGHFQPAPQVDSAILQVTDISLSHFADIDAAEFFFTIIHLGFGQKRKQLLGNLAAQYQRTQLEELFTRLNIPLHVRAEDVPITDWLALTKILHTMPTISNTTPT